MVENKTPHRLVEEYAAVNDARVVTEGYMESAEGLERGQEADELWVQRIVAG